MSRKELGPLAGIGAVVLLLWLGWHFILRAHFPDFRGVPLPVEVHTVAEGYPFAVKEKNRIDPEANLVCVQADSLERKGQRFEPDAFYYTFISRTGKGRTIMVMLLNAKHRIYIGLNHEGIQRHPFFPDWESHPLTSPEIDIPQVLGIASTNGLNDFYARAPGDSGEVSLTLGSSSNGAFWQIIGEGSGNKEDVEGLHLEIDSHTGAVLSDNLEKSVRRQNLK